MSKEKISPSVSGYLIIAIISSATTLVVSAIIFGVFGLTISVLAGIVTLIGASVKGHSYLRERDIRILEHFSGDLEEDDSGIFSPPNMVGLDRDSEFARELMDSKEYRYGGDGYYPELRRKIFGYMFKSSSFSNTRFEVGVFILAVFSMTMMFVVFASWMSTISDSFRIFEFIGALYPEAFLDGNPVYQYALPAAGMAFGFAYLETKGTTTCPEGVHFSLENKGRYFKPENQVEEMRKNDGESYRTTVAYGHQVFRCTYHDELYVKEVDWERGDD